MNSWKEDNLGVYIESISETYQFTNEPVVFLNTSDISNGKFLTTELSDPKTLPGQAKKSIRNGDFLFSEIRPKNRRFARVTFDANNYVVSTKLMVLRSKGDIDSVYLEYFLTSNEMLDYLQMIAEDRSGTFPQITFDIISSLKINLPPLPEQKAIAEVLSSLDDKIDLLHRQNKTLEAMAETLFRQWFVEEADESWEEGTLKDEFEILMGQSPPGDSYNEFAEGTPMYQGNKDFGFRFPTNRVFTTEPKRIAKPMDTLISVRAPVGAQNMANEQCCIGRGVASFRHLTNPDFYSYTYFKLRFMLEDIRKFNNEGTVFGSISKSDFQKMETDIPLVSDIEIIQEKIKPIDDKVISNTKQIQTLTNLRDTLLPKLMSGEVRVKSQRDATSVANIEKSEPELRRSDT